MSNQKYQTSHYKIVDSHHLTKDFINSRCRQLCSLKSPHYYTFADVRRQDKSIYIDYSSRHTSTLKEHINRGDLTDAHVTKIIWQITKMMCECQEKRINHLRLSPEAIAIRQVDTGNSVEWFLWVKDFSFGRQFRQTKKGEQFEHFEYMHPSFCMDCKSSSFTEQQFHPIYDIWSFGVILYKIIHKTTPFPNEKDNQFFSIETLKKYISNKHHIKYIKKDSKNINELIKNCLGAKFSSWIDIKRFLIEKEEIYSQMDFEAVAFQSICERHVKLMFLFSSIHTTIMNQCRHSDVKFWHERPLNRPFSYVSLIAEATLIIMNHIHTRFLKLYSGYSTLLPLNSNFLEQMDVITDSIANQLQNIQQFNILPFEDKQKFLLNSERNIDKELLSLIRNNCIQVKLMSGVSRNKARIRYKASQVTRRKQSFEQEDSLSFFQPQTSYKKTWKSVDILFDYCDGLIEIINQLTSSQQTIPSLTQLCHLSQIFNQMVVQDFKYKTPPSKVQSSFQSFLYKLPLNSLKLDKN